MAQPGECTRTCTVVESNRGLWVEGTLGQGSGPCLDCCQTSPDAVFVIGGIYTFTLPLYTSFTLAGFKECGQGC